MPSVSAKQHRLMEAVAHGWHKPGGGGPSQAVAKEFATGDRGRSFAGGGPVSNKGYMGKTESYARGGAVLGRTSDFFKTPDTFREEGESATDELYGKGMKAPKDHVSAPPAKGKTLKTVKPRK